MKLMLVGKEAAGKSSLSYFLLNNKRIEKAPLSTDGIDINNWDIALSEFNSDFAGPDPLLKAQCEQSANPCARSLLSTEIGDKLMKDNWANKPVSFSVWDFAGALCIPFL